MYIYVYIYYSFCLCLFSLALVFNTNLFSKQLLLSISAPSSKTNSGVSGTRKPKLSWMRNKCIIILCLCQGQLAGPPSLKCNPHGGPYQYLSANLMLDADLADPIACESSLKLQNDFAKDLCTYFPELDDVLYHHETHVPSLKSDDDMATSSPICFHISALGYCAPLCSEKDPPGSHEFLELLDLVLADGFKTANEPLLVTQPDELSHQRLARSPFCGSETHPLATASLGYVKGLRRTQTILAFAHWCIYTSVDLASVHPVLYNSILTIYGHRLDIDNKLEEVMKNMKISCSGSIRKPPNVIQMCSMCHKLVQKGCGDYQDFTRRWNMTAPRNHKIQGQKATSLKLQFTLCSPEVRAMILKHVLLMSWHACAWSDDNLSSKKMYMGYKFPGRGKAWSARGVVTEGSMKLQVHFIQYQHEHTAPYMRKKMSSADVTNLAERAAVVWHIGVEFMSMVPVKSDDVEYLGTPSGTFYK